jgi:hypothetical protein
MGRGDVTPIKPYQWAPGQSGNPSGKPAVLGDFRRRILACTRYGQDMLDFLLETVRDADAHPSARIEACKMLLLYGIGKPEDKPSDAQTPRLSLASLTTEELNILSRIFVRADFDQAAKSGSTGIIPSGDSAGGDPAGVDPPKVQ